ncbi:MAG: pseudouridine synthase [Bacillota bacterium]|jgi:23S rRNA pseudouridine2605 synthase|nr:pseudouridine synthase [Eubacteriales bacterium]MDI9491605.1 pseudouridine synthase [Bacillota bacterium]NLV70383.1 rRNA pseudouridine synthase [Clostridiales bacterium]MDD3537189.1 pseudouridine synthase [Eubacteriales bacterium]MDD4285466.1 pseudouridine synthase [Eubacteriales bacterium]
MRLNKYIAQAGIASRRKADDLTINGQVKINGKTMREPGYDVMPDDVVSVAGKVITNREALVYYALNKPPGYITTTADEQDRPTVLSLLRDVSERIFPVGRLDAPTTGLLILTNDGDLAQHLAHPSQHVYKTYVAEVEGNVSLDQLWMLRNGVSVDGYTTAPAVVRLLEEKQHLTTLEIQIHEGRNRQIRKMCAAVGHPVRQLERTAIGDIRLGRLKQGHYRKLTRREIDYLKNC